MLDLNQLDVKKGANKGAVLKLLHPASGRVLFTDEDKTDCFSLTLVGMDSDIYAKERKKLQEAARDSKDERDSEADGIELLIAATLDCNLVLDGKKVKLEDIGKIYKDLPWIAEQAIQFMADRGNFIKA